MSTTKRIPQIGDTVWYFPPAEDLTAKSNNNKGVIPAIITRNWGPDCTCACNIKIIPDHGSMQDRGSVASMYVVKGTRTWCFPGDFPLDVDGVPIFDSEVLAGPSQAVDTIRAGQGNY